ISKEFYIKLANKYQEVLKAFIRIENYIKKLTNSDINFEKDYINISLVKFIDFFIIDEELIKYLKIDFCDNYFFLVYEVTQNKGFETNDSNLYWKLCEHFEYSRENFLNLVKKFNLFYFNLYIEYFKHKVSTKLDNTIQNQIFLKICQTYFSIDDKNSSILKRFINICDEKPFDLKFFKHYHWVIKEKVSMSNFKDTERQLLITLIFKIIRVKFQTRYCLDNFSNEMKIFYNRIEKLKLDNKDYQ
ncbi:hypothetical protein GVAV_003470, partial [Gurleya vavrai]